VPRRACSPESAVLYLRQMNENEAQLLKTLETVTTQMAVAVSRCSRDFRYLWVNQAYANWIERPLNEIVDRPILEVLGKDAFEALRPHFNRVLTGEIVRYEQETNFQCIGPRWISAVYTPELDADGVVSGWVAVVIDITERKRTEEALRESEERLRLAAEVGKMYAFSWDVATDAIGRSGEPAEVMGVAQEAVATGAAVFAMVYPADKERLVAAMAQLTVEGPCLQISHRMIRPDGAVIWVERNVRAYFDEQGKMKRAVGMVVDVTETKRAEEAVKESDQRFRLVADSAPVMIWMSGTDKRPTYFNRRWLDFTGQSETDLQSGLAGLVHPDDYEKCHEVYCRGFDQQQPFTKECRLRRHDGQYRWMLDMGVPRFHEDGSFAGYIGSCVDITEQKLAEEALSSMSRRLIEAQEQERSRIARELHDDISQRLALVAMSLDRQRSDSHSTATEMRSAMRKATKQISDLVSDVHMISHRLHSSKLDTVGLAAAASGFCRELSRQQNVAIDFQCDGISKELPEAIALCMFRVLQEALQNAVRHSGAQHFKVSLAECTNQIALSICDDGRGFNPTEALNGSGLGLASMIERLKLVGGELLIDTVLKRGTTIRALVPFPYQAKSAASLSKWRGGNRQ
jgi:PAS domain S-box-containing protein